MAQLKNYRWLAVTLLLLAAVPMGCADTPTYDRNDPVGSVETMSAELSPEEEQEFVQAVGVLVGEFALQGMGGEAASTSDPVLQERLDRMDGMTAQEIIAYAEEVRTQR